MADGDDHVRCNRPDCQVRETGFCAEGHSPLASCPNFGLLGDDGLDVYDDETVVSGGPPPDGDEVRVSLPPGEALNSAEVEQFLRWRPATFITIVGDRDSGKSTLVYALYDRLLRGSFGRITFAGSRTLIALERRSHYSRVDSGRMVPDTPRTSHSEGLHYFHLALVPPGERPRRVDLLLSDRAGEVYRQARGNSAIIHSLSEVLQADRLVLLLDGRRVADAIERPNAIQSVRQTLRAFLDNGALGAASIVQVVTTKIDLIEAHDDAAVVRNELLKFQERLVKDFEPRLQELSFWKISARDPTGVFAPAHGLDALVADWVTPRSRRITMSPPPLVLKSEFDRLLARTPLEQGL